VPLVTTLFPSYWDGSKDVKTGQKLKVTNSSPLARNFRVTGTDGINDARNLNLPPATPGKPRPSEEVEMNPDPNAVRVNSDRHKWMRAWVWVFDHPFSAVTDENGSYKIENVPAGVEVSLVVWHAGAANEGFVNGRDGEKITLKAGKNVKNFKVTAK
jgi:hypothetical protein